MTERDRLETMKRLRGMTEQGLRDFLAEHDDGKHPIEMSLWNDECNRRARAAYESMNGGEWI